MTTVLPLSTVVASIGTMTSTEELTGAEVTAAVVGLETAGTTGLEVMAVLESRADGAVLERTAGGVLEGAVGAVAVVGREEPGREGKSEGIPEDVWIKEGEGPDADEDGGMMEEIYCGAEAVEDGMGAGDPPGEVKLDGEMIGRVEASEGGEGVESAVVTIDGEDESREGMGDEEPEEGGGKLVL